MIRIEFLPTPAELMRPRAAPAPMPVHSLGSDAGAVVAYGATLDAQGGASPAGQPLPSWVYPLGALAVIALVLKWAYGAKPVESSEGRVSDAVSGYEDEDDAELVDG